MHDLIENSELRGAMEKIEKEVQQATGKEGKILTKKMYREEYPRLAWDAAADSAEASYDVLVVDDAQDIMADNVLDVLDVVLKGGLEGGR